MLPEHIRGNTRTLTTAGGAQPYGRRRARRDGGFEALLTKNWRVRARDQGQLFYSFNLGEVVMPDDHLACPTADVLDLLWVRAELAPHYSALGPDRLPNEPRVNAARRR